MDKYIYWLKNIYEKDELQSLGLEEREESFYKDLEFGTGGMRGIMGIGTNRINKYTIRRATQGLADEILSHGDDFAKRGVVIAYDSRNGSHDFAVETARVLCGNGIKSYLFDKLRPTPELSFAVRYLNCARGIVITASHNPKEYNGYKVYGDDGGQLPPSVTDVITKFIADIDYFKDIKIGENTAQIIGNEIDEAYIKAVYEQRLAISIPNDFKIVYTPLHGAGRDSVCKVLKKIGLSDLLLVKEQELPNGDFPTVNVPNPENKDVFELGISLALKENADIVIATDPDSDRIGVACRKNNDFFLFNGNQIGALLAEFILRKSNPLPANSHIVKTIVTTDLIVKIANSYSAKVDNVLTGFKFIGEKIKEFENSGKNFIFGVEESYGYLKGTYARDKDAVIAAMLIAQMAAEYRLSGFTLYDGLAQLYKKYGYYYQELISKTYNGIDGNKKISEITKKFRDCPPQNTISVIDYSQEHVDGLPKSNVIKFQLANGWIVVRPSGTEPKIKVYIEVYDNDNSRATELISKLKNMICEEYLKTEPLFD